MIFPLLGVSKAWPTGTKGFFYGTGDPGHCDTVGSSMDKDDLSDLVFFGGHTKSISKLQGSSVAKCADVEVAFISHIKYNTLPATQTPTFEKFFPEIGLINGETGWFVDVPAIRAQ